MKPYQDECDQEKRKKKYIYETKKRDKSHLYSTDERSMLSQSIVVNEWKNSGIFNG